MAYIAYKLSSTCFSPFSDKYIIWFKPQHSPGYPVPWQKEFWNLTTDESKSLVRGYEYLVSKHLMHQIFLFSICLVQVFSPVAFRKAKIVYNFDLSECSRVKLQCYNFFFLS